MNLIVLQFSIILLCVINISTSEEDAPKVNTSLGQIKGQYKVSYGNRTYKSFTSVPYAKPPVGERRYRPPEPIDAWTDELDATKETATCIQHNFNNDDIVGEEDCLYLNIYVPKTNHSQPLPIIFYIHGGAFQSGNSTEQGPRYLMDKDVILVTTNYRLGSIGFLSTGDEVLPGNNGLKDQSMALRWVSYNIGYFGGDPKRITLAGCSAGAASVHYHYFSPMSAGLFQNGISMSGTALSTWVLAEDPMKDTIKLAKILNCPTGSSEEIVSCLKKLPAHDICKAAYKLMWSEYLSRGIWRPVFRPVVEKIKQGYFINRSPRQIMESNDVQDVPWITGVVSAEGIIISYGYVLNQTSLSYIDKNWDLVGPYVLFLQDEMTKEKRTEVARKARQHYFGNDSFTVSDSNIKKFVQMTGDKIFSYDAQKVAVLQAKVNKSPVQVYYYNYRAATSLSNVLLKTPKNYSACHADDNFMILNNTVIDPTLRSEDMRMSQFLIDMWYTLANAGQADIGIEWPKVDSTSENLQYLHIDGPDEVNIKTTDNFSEKKFWKSVGF